MKAFDIHYYWMDKAARAQQAKDWTEKNSKIFASQIKRAVESSQIYDNNSQFDIPEKVELMPIDLVAMGSTEAIYEYAKEEKGTIAVLNFASYKNPGGGFLSGSRAQEECLCHESYLYNVLAQFPDYYTWNNDHKNHCLYENRAIYSKEIGFEHNGTITFCDVITCAAPNISPSRKYGYGISEAENSAALDSRIKFVLSIAADQKVDTLILGAFGCGVFGQDATEVAQIFRKYLSTDFKVFKRVVFAIPTNVHSENYTKFYETLMQGAAE